MQRLYHTVRRPAMLAAAAGALAAGCSDPAGPHVSPVPGPSLAAEASGDTTRALDTAYVARARPLARGLARATGEPAARAALRKLFRRSRLGDYAVPLESLAQDAEGARILTAVAAALGQPESRVREMVTAAGRLDLVVPLEDDRLKWKGSAEPLVAVLADPRASEVVAYQAGGDSVVLRKPDLATKTAPVVVLKPAGLRARRLGRQTTGDPGVIQSADDGQISGVMVRRTGGDSLVTDLADLGIEPRVAPDAPRPAEHDVNTAAMWAPAPASTAQVRAPASAATRSAPASKSQLVSGPPPHLAAPNARPSTALASDGNQVILRQFVTRYTDTGGIFLDTVNEPYFKFYIAGERNEVRFTNIHRDVTYTVDLPVLSSGPPVDTNGRIGAEGWDDDPWQEDRRCLPDISWGPNDSGIWTTGCKGTVSMLLTYPNRPRLRVTRVEMSGYYLGANGRFPQGCSISPIIPVAYTSDGWQMTRAWIGANVRTSSSNPAVAYPKSTQTSSAVFSLETPGRGTATLYFGAEDGGFFFGATTWSWISRVLTYPSGSHTIQPGTTTQVSAVVYDGSGTARSECPNFAGYFSSGFPLTPVEWTSSNPAVVSVASSGVLTGSYTGGQTGTAAVSARLGVTSAAINVTVSSTSPPPPPEPPCGGTIRC